MCLKTFGRFRTNIGVVSVSRIKSTRIYQICQCTYARLKYRKKDAKCSIFLFLFFTQFIVAKKGAMLFCIFYAKSIFTLIIKLSILEINFSNLNSFIQHLYRKTFSASCRHSLTDNSRHAIGICDRVFTNLISSEIITVRGVVYLISHPNEQPRLFGHIWMSARKQAERSNPRTQYV